jgi:hypothetical protein
MNQSMGEGGASAHRSAMEPSATTWWRGGDDRWYPPDDGKIYALPQYVPPRVRTPGPRRPSGKSRNPWSVIGLSIVTLGIYFIWWEWKSFTDLKEFSGVGIGGGLGLFFAILIPIVNSFVLPSEIGSLYAADGTVAPVTGLTGFWTFIPIAGSFVWAIKVQNALNEMWEFEDRAS